MVIPGDYVRLTSVKEIATMAARHGWGGPCLKLGDLGVVRTQPDLQGVFEVDFPYCRLCCSTVMVEPATVVLVNLSPTGPCWAAIQSGEREEMHVEKGGMATVLMKTAALVGWRCRIDVVSVELWREE
jgi:hypothetical protein